jgi:hypothetical protein
VLPVPEDYPDHVHMTGYWFLDRDAAWQPSPELLEFLEAGRQPFWGKRVHALGVGPKPIPQGRITPENLATALIQTLQDGGMQTRAAALRERITLEDGVANAIQKITAI